MKPEHRKRRRVNRLVITLIGVAQIWIAGSDRVRAEDRAQPDEARASQAAAKSQREHLAVLIGPWRLKETHFNPRGQAVASVKGEETISWKVEERVLQREYKTFGDKLIYHAIGLFVWNEVDKKYRGAWFDNISTTGPTLAYGEWAADTRSFVFTLEATAADGSKQLYRRIEELIDAEHRVATTYLLQGSAVIKVLEVSYERTVPCPSGIRRIFDDSMRSGG